MRTPTLTVAAIVLAALTVRAETPGAPAAAPGPCTADIARFCKDTATGEGRLRACLMAHEQELATECHTRIAGPASTGPAMAARQLIACQADLEKHCAKVPSGGGRLRACLEEHAGVVTPACKAALAKGPEAPKPRRP